jgi:predicted CxxxxCH...CXXCH cytochrome family protein
MGAGEAMKSQHKFLIAVMAVSVAWTGCADLKSDLPASTDPGVIAHPPGFTDALSPDFHGNVIRAANWDMRSCQQCHGPLYAGGLVESSCRDCHTGSGGPENCSTCHGSSNPAPPRDLSKNTLTTARGVGAHQIHIGLNPVTIGSCNECHVVPGPTYDPQHIDSSPGAELVFNGPLANVVSGNGTRVPNPSYDAGTMRCNNSFCHGNFESDSLTAPPQFQFAYSGPVMSGLNSSPLWTGGPAEADCGTCHGLPPTGHVGPLPRTTCGNSGCHPGVVNAAGNIADATKHMNGRINVQGQEYSFR